MRSLRSSRALLVGAALALAPTLFAACAASREDLVDEKLEIAPVALEVPDGPEAIAEGRRLYLSRGCVDCHEEELSGKLMIDDPFVGRVAGSNLTPGEGSAVRGYTAADFERALRHGVRPDGTPLVVMPSQEYYWLSDAEVGALIAYIRSAPPVDEVHPEPEIRCVGRALHAFGAIPLVPAKIIDHDAPRPDVPVESATAENGERLARMTCAGCHGASFSGGPIPGVTGGAVPTNLTPDLETGLGRWTEADFLRAMREGKRPDGSAIDPSMPWQGFRHMTDDELQGLWAFLRTLPPLDEGNR